jgi:(2Fe-2S) ferredoxin
MPDSHDQPRRRLRIVLCRGQYCNIGRRADKLYQRLETAVAEANDGVYPPRIKLEVANCLDMCGAGPNLILYPDHIIYNHVDEVLLERIIERLKDEDSVES